MAPFGRFLAHQCPLKLDLLLSIADLLNLRPGRRRSRLFRDPSAALGSEISGKRQNELDIDSKSETNFTFSLEVFCREMSFLLKVVSSNPAGKCCLPTGLNKKLEVLFPIFFFDDYLKSNLMQVMPKRCS